MTQPNQSELDMNMIEKIIADHNKAMRTDMASEIVGGTRSKAITDVITVKAILNLINSEAERREREARVDEIRRTRPHLTYPGMVYYGERMNELRSDEEEVK